jgi:hypothetical protein
LTIFLAEARLLNGFCVLEAVGWTGVDSAWGQKKLEASLSWRSPREKCLKMATNPTCRLHAMLGRFYGIEVVEGRHNKVTIGYENITEEDPTEILTIDSFPKM